MRKLVTVVVIAACGLGLLGACSSDEYDREDFVKEMQEAGISAEQANCIADAIESQIDLEKAAKEQSDLTPEQEQIITEATTKCLLGDIEVVQPGG